MASYAPFIGPLLGALVVAGLAVWANTVRRPEPVPIPIPVRRPRR